MIHPSSTFTIYQTLNHQGYNAAIRALAASAVYLHPLISLAPWAEALKLCRTAGVLRVSTGIHSVLVNQSVVDITKCRTLFVLFVFNNVVSICFMFYSRDTPRYPTLVSCFFVFAELPAPFFSAWKRRQNHSFTSAWLINLQENGRRFCSSRFGHLQWATWLLHFGDANRRDWCGTWASDIWWLFLYKEHPSLNRLSLDIPFWNLKPGCNEKRSCQGRFFVSVLEVAFLSWVLSTGFSITTNKPDWKHMEESCWQVDQVQKECCIDSNRQQVWYITSS